MLSLKTLGVPAEVLRALAGALGGASLVLSLMRLMGTGSLFFLMLAVSSLESVSPWAESSVRFFAVGLVLRPDLEILGAGSGAEVGAFGVEGVVEEREPNLSVNFGVEVVAD